MIYLRLNMRFAESFQTARDNFHLEQRKHFLNCILHVFEYRYFLLDRQRAVFVKDASENVLPLNDGTCLFNDVLCCPVENHFEKLGVVVQL